MVRTIILLAAALAGAQAAAETMDLITDGRMADFERQTSDKIPNHTVYEWVDDPGAPGGRALEGYAEGAAAGMVLEGEFGFSPEATLEVTYSVLEASNPEDEMTKEGDDFPLRLYVSDKTGLLSYSTLVLVNSIQYPAGTAWDSPYSGAVAEFQMHVFAGTESPIGEWRTVTIPVGRLWQERFGDPSKLIALSFMVDTDNAGGTSRTRIGRLVYSH